MEKEGFGECLQWLKKVTEESIKDFDTFCATFNDLEQTAKVNAPKIIRKKKEMEIEEEERDDSYKESGDVDSDFDSENESILHTENFLDEGNTNNIISFLRKTDSSRPPR
jgi:hypothetical protein